MLLVDRSPARRDHDLGLHAADRASARVRRWSMCIPTPRSSAASTSPDAGDQRRPGAVRGRAARAPAARRLTLERRARAGARGLSRQPAQRPASRSRGHVRGDGAPARARCRTDAILTNGAGNFSVWAHRFYEFRRFRTQLAPTSGAMGYGVPAAVAAKLLHPERIVVAFAGDGDFLMTGPGARDRRAVRRRDRRARRQQRHVRDDPDAPGAPLPRPGVRHRPRQPRLRRARPGVRRVRSGRRADRRVPGGARRRAQSGAPALVELRVDPEALTPRQTLSEIREAALGR